jgi:hypothetical protein
MFLLLGMRPMLTRLLKRRESGGPEATIEVDRKPNP